MAKQTKKFQDYHSWARAVADEISQALAQAIAENDRAGLIVPGGRTAARILPILSQMDLDWSRVTLVLTDERWVDPEQPDSNEGLVRRSLLVGAAGAASLVSLKTPAEHPGEALAEVERRLSELPRPFDAVFLGMGEDGHIASLFPGDEVAAQARGGCVAVERSDHPRLSLTARTLLDSRRIFLATEGQRKAEILTKAQEPGPVLEFPVRHVLHQAHTPVDLFVCCPRT